MVRFKIYSLFCLLIFFVLAQSPDPLESCLSVGTGDDGVLRPLSTPRCQQEALCLSLVLGFHAAHHLPSAHWAHIIATLLPGAFALFPFMIGMVAGDSQHAGLPTTIKTPTGESFEFSIYQQDPGSRVVTSYKGVRQNAIAPSLFRIIARFEGKVVGFADAEIDRTKVVMNRGLEPYPSDQPPKKLHVGGNVIAIEVDPDFRTRYKGIGTALLGFVERIGFQLGAKEFLIAEAAKDVETFYKKAGFSPAILIPSTAWSKTVASPIIPLVIVRKAPITNQLRQNA